MNPPGLPLDTLQRVETPEGITLGLRPAGWVPRSLAFLVDLLLRAMLFLAGAVTLGQLGGTGDAALLVLLFVLEWFYPVLFELLPGGATPGKRLLGLHVCMDSGLPVTPAAAMLRNLLRAVDFLPMLYAAGALVMLARPDFKRLGDLAAGTLVVHTDRPGAGAALPEAAPRPPRRTLSLAERRAVLDWAARRQQLTPERLEELAQLARPILPAAEAGAGAATTATTTAPTTAATPTLLGIAAGLLGRKEPPT